MKECCDLFGSDINDKTVIQSFNQFAAQQAAKFFPHKKNFLMRRRKHLVL